MSETAVRPDIDFTDGTFYADGRARAAYGWMRANEPVFRDRNGLAAASTHQAVLDAERTPEVFSSTGGIRPDNPAMPYMIDMDDPAHLLRRKLGAAAPATAPAPRDREEAEPEPAPAEPSGLQEGAAEPAVDEKRLEAARRYARLVATDIRLYNEEAVMQGRRGGDLVQRLGDQIGRGKETFLRRHGSLGPTGLEILHEAYVQVLAGGDEALMPPSVLD